MPRLRQFQDDIDVLNIILRLIEGHQGSYQNSIENRDYSTLDKPRLVCLLVDVRGVNLYRSNCAAIANIQSNVQLLIKQYGLSMKNANRSV